MKGDAIMEPMKNLCGLIPESLHKRLMEGKDPEMTNGEYLTKVLTAACRKTCCDNQARAGFLHEK